MKRKEFKRAGWGCRCCRADNFTRKQTSKRVRMRTKNAIKKGKEIEIYWYPT